MSDTVTFDYSRLADYLNGECSPEEARAVEAWIDAHPERQTLLDYLRAWQDAPGETGRPEAGTPKLEPVYEAVLARIGEEDTPAGRSGAPQSVLPSGGSWQHGDRRDRPRHLLSSLRAGVSRLLAGGAGRMVATLLDEQETTLSTTEVERLRRVIEEAEEEDG